MSNRVQNNVYRNCRDDSREQITNAAKSSMTSFPGRPVRRLLRLTGDYTKKSFEDTKSFVEKLSGVTSVGKAIELQTEFAKSTFETFMGKSQKIGALYRDLTTQSYKPFGGFSSQSDAPQINKS